MDFNDEQTGGLSLKEWAELDLGAIAIIGAKKFVRQRPILVSVWVFGLMLAALAGGAPVGTEAQLSYDLMRNHSDAIDRIEIGRARAEWRRHEAEYYAAKGFFWSCDANCTRAHEKLQLSEAELARVGQRRDKALAEARREVGIWSTVGVQDVRKVFWSAWQSAKEFAARMSWWDTMFMTAGRDEPLQQVMFRMIGKFALNLTLGLISCFCYFMYALYGLIVSYGSSFLSGLAFFLLAAVAGLSITVTYLGAMYGVIGGGYMMYMKQLAIRQAIEGAEGGQRPRLDDSQAGRRPGAYCPV